MPLSSLTIIQEELATSLDLDATDLDNAEWVTRAKQYLQRVVGLVWNREWSFGYTSATVTVPAGPNKTYTDGRITAPAKFQRVGMQGAIYPQGRPDDLIHYMNPTHFFRRRESGKSIASQLAGQDCFYTVFDFDPAAALSYLYFEPFLFSPQDVRVYYQRQRPVVDTGGGDELGNSFPEDFDELFRIGLSDWLLQKVGDARSLEQMSPRFREVYAQIQSRYRHGGDALERKGSRGIRRFGMH